MEKGASEIVKLTERISKDPKSKLFVPLAEEYKKIGDIEMAIQVLQEGLKNNPSYVTARSFLGRLLLENGDLPGAQKELEEVIKAIPDNLLAQRKLAELFILTGRIPDSLQRFKTVLALNPGDKEVKALVADLEAGKDISDRIPKPKAPPSAPAAAAPASKPAAAAPPKAAVAAPAAAAQPIKPVLAPAAAPPKVAAAIPPSPTPPPTTASQTQQKPAPSPPPASEPAPIGMAAETADTIEEIVELEHLEPQVEPAGPAAVPGADAAVAPAPAAMEPAFDLAEGSGFDLTEGAGEAAAFTGEPEAVKWEPPVAGGAPLAVEPEAESWEPPAPQTAPAPAAAEAPNDDINTNTLAELYITQGFYEKAIEIYEGMLAEKPGSAALQQKLAKIRAMAGVAEKNATFTAPVTEPSADAAKIDVFATQAEAAGATEPAAEQAPPTRPVEPPAPPMAPETDLPRTAPPVAAAPAGPQAASARRKETIDRLESWLKNIIKEKP